MVRLSPLTPTPPTRTRTRTHTHTHIHTLIVPVPIPLTVPVPVPLTRYKVFNYIDHDGSGRISWYEFRGFIRNTLGLNQERSPYP